MLDGANGKTDLQTSMSAESFFFVIQTKQDELLPRREFLLSPRQMSKNSSWWEQTVTLQSFIIKSPFRVTAYAPHRVVAKCLKFYEDMKIRNASCLQSLHVFMAKCGRSPEQLISASLEKHSLPHYIDARIAEAEKGQIPSCISLRNQSFFPGVFATLRETKLFSVELTFHSVKRR